MGNWTPASQTDFILVGLLNNNGGLPTIFFTLISITFVVALTGNSAMIALIHIDPQLHTPMYFLISHLSFMDAMYICTTVPKMMVDQLTGQKTISFWGCMTQIFLYVTLLGAECLLLGLMAYDRYVAIIHPLRYPILMSQRRCIQMAAVSWLFGATDGFLVTPIAMSFPYCGSRVIDSFFCQVPALLKLSCIDTSVYESVMYVCCIVMLLVPFALIAFSYGQIAAIVLGMRSAHARKKAMATCSSHLIVVGLFYGAAIFTYMLPNSYHTPGQDRVVSIFYTILTPVLNPVIYGLRNKQVSGALWKVLGRCTSIQRM
ncbi:olfactory receptor 2T27-like [Tachyglossus aculeatus]|uniref:olfactory receptor 2T27-like n=1 Tax=Tachyglossus aculeatus TaxID=9261 RepID=UPI0018F78BF1|nr:olfactory receptor 2T27-like [Tachyglossus aculeatus]